MLVKVKVVEVKKAWVKAPRDKRRVVAVVGCNWLAAKPPAGLRHVGRRIWLSAGCIPRVHR